MPTRPSIRSPLRTEARSPLATKGRPVCAAACSSGLSRPTGRFGGGGRASPPSFFCVFVIARQRRCVRRTLVATKWEAPRRCFVSLLEAFECVAYLFYRPALCVHDEALRIVVVGVNRVCIDSAVSKDCFDLSATSSEFRGAPSWHFRDLDLALFNEPRLSRAALVKYSFPNLRDASFTRLLDGARFDAGPTSLPIPRRWLGCA